MKRYIKEYLIAYIICFCLAILLFYKSTDNNIEKTIQIGSLILAFSVAVELVKFALRKIIHYHIKYKKK
ncbi:hypothetical protein [Sinanaerobacter sp. ZZT-01]|uniref:hypothetical protein n=1 Tax=Sinanaerobacter sp. ZZT-01 TaxID=3111540 RepID=UPI002D799216|nr:hypothetical protein [Sinanaerobacter sp. ZZT-01]WRR94422.1 hypothetical protein U5921_04715 [Sinanaerobacter sp. ZZT-01]